MKRFLLLTLMVGSMICAGLASSYAQDDDLFDDKKDTISIDDMDPVFYEAEEEENAESGNTALIIGIVAGVVVVAAGAFFIVKKKK